LHLLKLSEKTMSFLFSVVYISLIVLAMSFSEKAFNKAFLLKLIP
jgi:hypothetical protein